MPSWTESLGRAMQGSRLKPLAERVVYVLDCLAILFRLQIDHHAHQIQADADEAALLDDHEAVGQRLSPDVTAPAASSSIGISASTVSGLLSMKAIQDFLVPFAMVGL